MTGAFIRIKRDGKWQDVEVGSYPPNRYEEVARHAYHLAAAMLAERTRHATNKN